MVSEYGGEHRLSWCFFGLNPCSCGGWSQSLFFLLSLKIKRVLILVLVEDGLRGGAQEVAFKF